MGVCLGLGCWVLVGFGGRGVPEGAGVVGVLSHFVFCENRSLVFSLCPGSLLVFCAVPPLPVMSEVKK